jgi:transcriptional regulator with XRE-family HTH domain
VPKSNFTQDYALFREMLKSLRLERGRTQADLSSALGMPQSFVSKYEMGERRLDFVEVARICNELDKPLPEFAEEFSKAVRKVEVAAKPRTKGGSKR